MTESQIDNCDLDIEESRSKLPRVKVTENSDRGANRLALSISGILSLCGLFDILCVVIFGIF